MQNPIKRGRYGQLLEAKENLSKAMDILSVAFRLGRLPKPYMDEKKGESLQYDLYDVLGNWYAFQQRLSTRSKYGWHPKKEYFLLKRRGRGLIMEKIAPTMKPVFNLACKRSQSLGEAIGVIRGTVRLGDIERAAREMAAQERKERVAEIEAHISRWQKEGLCPDIDDSILVWKHVQRERSFEHIGTRYTGNKGMPYHVGASFACKEYSMACAGPYGALKDWSKNGTSQAHVLAILVPRTEIEMRDRDGVFCFYKGTPIAAYVAFPCIPLEEQDNPFADAPDEWELKLIEGVDALSYLSEPPQEAKGDDGDADDGEE